MENSLDNIKCATVKYIIVGDSGVGKSCLIKQFLTNEFEPMHAMTIGVEFGSKIYCTNNNRFKLQIWDTAGQERFRSITRSFYRGAACALLVFDVSNRESFKHIQTWINEVDEYCHNPTNEHMVKMMLVGNKCDTINRQISTKEGMQLAKENRIDYIETSAKTGHNINHAFYSLIDNNLNSLNIVGVYDNKNKYISIQKPQMNAFIPNSMCLWC